MKKTILVINIKNPSRVSHFKKLKSMNYHFTLLMKNPTWETQFFDDVINTDTNNIIEVLQRVDILSKNKEISGVFTLVEHAVPLASIIAEYLCIEGLGLKIAQKCRLKNEMRAAFSDYKIPCPNYDIARDIQTGKEICSKLKYPIVIKPLIGGGSLSVMRINNEDELVINFNKLQKGSIDEFEYDYFSDYVLKEYHGAMLIEEYISGKEISVESVSYHGEVKVIAIHDKVLPMEGPFFEEKLFHTPSGLDDEVKREVELLTKLAHKALGIENGVCHTEFRIDKNNNPIIIELGARIGGGPVYLSVLNSTGVDLIEIIVGIALGNGVDVIGNLEAKHVGFQHFFSDKEGIVQSIRLKKDATLNSDIIEFLPYLSKGDKVQVPPNSVAHAHVIVAGDDLLTIQKKITDIENDVEIVLEDENGK